VLFLIHQVEQIIEGKSSLGWTSAAEYDMKVTCGAGLGHVRALAVFMTIPRRSLFRIELCSLYGVQTELLT
jgi:hypothetical protein